jgi:hypothetical protein
MAAYLQSFGDLASRLVKEARNKAADVVDAAQVAKAAGVQRIVSIRELAFATYADAKRQGFRAWSLEMSRFAGAVTGLKLRELRAFSYAALSNARTTAVAKALDAKAKAEELSVATKEFASKKSVQTTAASAVGGAVAMGTGGAVTGAATGSIAGAAAGLPFALFTFGLSIPVGAVLGGGAGIVVGATTGATAGAMGGGAAGYGAYQNREQICNAAGAVAAKATSGAEFVKDKASNGAEFVKGKANSGADFVKGTAQKSADWTKEVASATRARLTRASTGSTD